MVVIANNIRINGLLRTSLTPGDAPAFTPTTWSPTFKGDNVTLSDGDLTANTDGGTSSGLSVAGVSSGKYYWEIDVITSSIAMIGIGTLDIVLNEHPGNGAQNDAAFAYFGSDGTVRHDGNTRAFGGATYTSGDLISVALDMGTGQVWFAKNGVWQGASADPAAGTGAVQDNNGLIPLATALSQSTVYAVYGDGSSGTASILTANFGATAFTHTVPTGFTSGFGN